MIWGLLAVGLIGLLVGLRFRVPMLLAALLGTVVVTVVISVLHDWSALAVLRSTGAFVVTLQFAYFVGLFLSSAWPRARSHDH